jgi:hypothetical protein
MKSCVLIIFVPKYIWNTGFPLIHKNYYCSIRFIQFLIGNRLEIIIIIIIIKLERAVNNFATERGRHSIISITHNLYCLNTKYVLTSNCSVFTLLYIHSNAKSSNTSYMVCRHKVPGRTVNKQCLVKDP